MSTQTPKARSIKYCETGRIGRGREDDGPGRTHTPSTASARAAARPAAPWSPGLPGVRALRAPCPAVRRWRAAENSFEGQPWGPGLGRSHRSLRREAHAAWSRSKLAASPTRLLLVVAPAGCTGGSTGLRASDWQPPRAAELSAARSIDVGESSLGPALGVYLWACAGRM